MAAKSGPMPWLKPAVLAGALLPLVDLFLGAARGTLGADPIDLALNRLGRLSLIMLLLSLVPTPLKILFDATWPVRIRRYLGNLAFTYVSLHFLTYALLDKSLAVGEIVEDIAKRPFILIGFTAIALGKRIVAKQAQVHDRDRSNHKR